MTSHSSSTSTTTVEGPSHLKVSAVTFLLCGEPITLRKPFHFSEHLNARFSFKSSSASAAAAPSSTAENGGTITLPPLAIVSSASTATSSSLSDPTAATVVIGLDMSQAFAVAHSFGITPLLLQVRHPQDKEAIVLIPDPDSKRVSIHEHATYELGALVGATLVRLTTSMVATLRRWEEERRQHHLSSQQEGGCIEGSAPQHKGSTSFPPVCDEMTYRLWRGFLAFQRRVLAAVTDPESVNAGLDAGARIGARLLWHKEELKSMGMQAAQNIVQVVNNNVEGTAAAAGAIVVDHPWLRPPIHRLLAENGHDDDDEDVDGSEEGDDA